MINDTPQNDININEIVCAVFRYRYVIFAFLAFGVLSSILFLRFSEKIYRTVMVVEPIQIKEIKSDKILFPISPSKIDQFIKTGSLQNRLRELAVEKNRSVTGKIEIQSAVISGTNYVKIVCNATASNNGVDILNDGYVILNEEFKEHLAGLKLKVEDWLLEVDEEIIRAEKAFQVKSSRQQDELKRIENSEMHSRNLVKQAENRIRDMQDSVMMIRKQLEESKDDLNGWLENRTISGKNTSHMRTKNDQLIMLNSIQSNLYGSQRIQFEVLNAFHNQRENLLKYQKMLSNISFQRNEVNRKLSSLTFEYKIQKKKYERKRNEILKMDAYTKVKDGLSVTKVKEPEKEKTPVKPKSVQVVLFATLLSLFAAFLYISFIEIIDRRKIELSRVSPPKNEK